MELLEEIWEDHIKDGDPNLDFLLKLRRVEYELGATAVLRLFLSGKLTRKKADTMLREICQRMSQQPYSRN